RLSDSSYSLRAISILFASVLRECPMREDVNPILRKEGDLEEADNRHQQSAEQPCGKYHFLLM
ncbi:hypothetical protein ALC56_10383, partial [Trachymyrmex septentrionalis]